MSYSIEVIFAIKESNFTKTNVVSFLNQVAKRHSEIFVFRDLEKEYTFEEGLAKNIERLFNLRSGGSVGLGFHDKIGATHDFLFCIHPSKKYSSKIEFKVELSSPQFYFRKPNADEHVEYFFDYVKLIALVFKPEYGRGDHELAFEDNNYDFEKIYWLNLFSPKDVKKIGHEKILSAPAYKIEELEDGSVLLVATEKQEKMSEEIVNKISRHLGLDSKI